MSFKYIYRCALCVLLLAATPTNEVNAQATQVVKTVSKWFGKKAAKEGAEEVVEQGVKAVSKDMAQKAITKNAANAIYKPSATFARKNLQEYAATNIGKTFTTKLGKELGEGALKTMSKEFAQQIGRSTSKEAQELFIKRVGTEGTQEAYELSAKKSMQESAFDTKKSWSEKLKDKYHQLRLSLLQKIYKSKIYKELLEIYAKGPINLTQKELTDLLAHPKKNFRYILKAKMGKKVNVVEFLIRLKMSNPQYVKQILDNPNLLSYIKKSIRGNKGAHEWLMVKNIEDFLLNPKWGKEGDFLAIALQRLTQSTDNVLFKIGGKHGSENSTKFHNGLSKVIDESSSIEELFVNIRRYAKKNLTTEAYNEFLKILEQTLEAV